MVTQMAGELLNSQMYGQEELNGGEEPGDMIFSLANYPKEALKMLHIMRSHHMLTDVILELNGEEIHAHKVVLSAASPYFKAMFTSGLKETEMSRIKLQGVSVTK